MPPRPGARGGGGCSGPDAMFHIKGLNAGDVTVTLVEMQPGILGGTDTIEITKRINVRVRAKG